MASYWRHYKLLVIPRLNHQKHRTRSKSRLKDSVESRRNRDKKHQDVVNTSNMMTTGGATSLASDTKNPQTGPVILYDISCLLPIHKQLADTYV